MIKLKELERLIEVTLFTGYVKGERYHRSLKGEINQFLYDMPSNLEKAIAAFI